jgi:hypothetical protein
MRLAEKRGPWVIRLHRPLAGHQRDGTFGPQRQPVPPLVDDLVSGGFIAAGQDAQPDAVDRQ